MEIALLARSSSGEGPYSVVFVWEKKRLHVRCDCRAGMFGKWCKHKTAMLANDETMLQNPSELVELRKVNDWVQQTTFSDRLQLLHQAENELGALEKRIKIIKDELAEALKNGLE